MIQFVNVVPFDSKGRARTSRHSFVEDRLLVIHSGHYRARIGRQAVEGQGGDVILFPSRVVIHDHSFAGDVLRCTPVLFHWPDRPASLPLRVSDGEGRMAALTEWLLAEARTSAPNTPMICNHYTAALAGEYVRLGRQDEPPLVRAVRAYGVRHMAESIRLSELAVHLHLHPRYLIRKFKALCGMTPMAFFRRQKLEQARRLAYETDAPLKALADQVGLGDAYQLSRLFKRGFGVGVRDLRKARLR